MSEDSDLHRPGNELRDRRFNDVYARVGGVEGQIEGLERQHEDTRQDLRDYNASLLRLHEAQGQQFTQVLLQMNATSEDFVRFWRVAGTVICLCMVVGTMIFAALAANSIRNSEADRAERREQQEMIGAR